MTCTYCIFLDVPNIGGGDYLVRQYRVEGVLVIGRADTLEGARLLLPPGLTLIEHQPGEDSSLQETWL